jgi:hypothetical protein
MDARQASQSSQDRLTPDIRKQTFNEKPIAESATCFYLYKPETDNYSVDGY